MSVERIFTKQNDQSQVEHARVRVIAGKGIEDDRYFGCVDEPGQNVTFIEAEEIEAFQQSLGRPLDLSVTGRNIVMRGVRLNDLVGKTFSVGDVRFRGVELCEPCSVLGRALALPGLTPAQVVKRLVHRAGLRADALSSGEIRRGASLELASDIESAKATRETF